MKWNENWDLCSEHHEIQPQSWLLSWKTLKRGDLSHIWQVGLWQWRGMASLDPPRGKMAATPSGKTKDLFIYTCVLPSATFCAVLNSPAKVNASKWGSHPITSTCILLLWLPQHICKALEQVGPVLLRLSGKTWWRNHKTHSGGVPARTKGQSDSGAWFTTSHWSFNGFHLRENGFPAFPNTARLFHRWGRGIGGPNSMNSGLRCRSTARNSWRKKCKFQLANLIGWRETCAAIAQFNIHAWKKRNQLWKSMVR